MWIVPYVAQHNLDFCRSMLFSMQSQKINLIYARQMHSKYEVGLNIYRLVSPVPLLMTCKVLENNQQ